METRIIRCVFIFALFVSLSGCTFVFQKGRRTDIEKIRTLSQRLDTLADAKKILEEQLAQEIRDNQVKLKMMEKGLVVTFLTDILFDSGKAKVKPEAFVTLDKISKVLQENVPNLSVAIEGHTDDQPIRYSGWKSNWELSTGRALSILHYLVDEKGIAPERVSAVGYGEYRPVASNHTRDGRRANRRVEIVILPPMQRVKEGMATQLREDVSMPSQQTPKLSEPKENLK
jgi:chemotaxis protein MotB